MADGGTLFDLRRPRKLSAAQVGQMVGRSHTSILDYEAGRRTPGGETLIRLARFYSKSPEEILRRIRSGRTRRAGVESRGVAK